MKRLIAAAVLLALSVGGLSYSSNFSAGATTLPQRSVSLARLRIDGWAMIRSALTRLRAEQATSATATPTLGTAIPAATATATTTGTATPLPTATTTTYPDPITLLQASQVAITNVHSVHYVDPFKAQIVGVVTDSFKAGGNANDRQPGFTAHVVATHKDAVGHHTRKTIFNFVIIKKTAYGKAPFTHKKWQKVKLRRVCANFNDRVTPCVTLDNPLVNETTSTSSGSGSGGPSQPTNLQNLGPAVFHGVHVWHLQATEVDQGVPGKLDILVSSANYLPVEIAVTFATKNTTPEQKLYEAQILSKFNSRVVIKAPKLGKK